MRFLLLCLAASLSLAAEYVELTLKDGRRLTGTYDAETGVLDLGLGKMAIAADQIASLAKAVPPSGDGRRQTRRADDPLAEYNAKLDELAVKRSEALADLRVRLRPVLLGFDYRPVDVEVLAITRNGAPIPAEITAVNAGIAKLKAYAEGLMVADFLKGTPKAYQAAVGFDAGVDKTTPNDFLAAIELLTDSTAYAAYTASRSQPLGACRFVQLDAEKDRLKAWLEQERARKANDERLRRQSHQPEPGGSIILGQPKPLQR